MSEAMADWNGPQPGCEVVLVDETLRDGIQSSSVRNPPLPEKLALLRLMARCGVGVANVGMPGAGGAAIDDAAGLASAIAAESLPIRPCCAARTHDTDLSAVAEVSQRSGVAIEVNAFLGTSSVRQELEGWDRAFLRARVRAAAARCRREGLPFSFVTEDTTRSAPSLLSDLWRDAIDAGAERLVLCDTVGHATAAGLRRLVDFARRVIAQTGATVQLDWHGHNDRGLALPLGVLAAEYGVDRVHGTCLGVGERVGNTPLDLLMVNLHLSGERPGQPEALAEYVRLGSQILSWPIPRQYPVFGADAFRTATGVHAAAIVKALARGREDLADQVYSAVPASDFGCHQKIGVGYYSGRANALHWLSHHGLKPSPERVEAILNTAKRSRFVLTDNQLHDVIRSLDPPE